MSNLNETLTDGVHHYGLRIYYEDTDAIGHARARAHRPAVPARASRPKRAMMIPK